MKTFLAAKILALGIAIGSVLYTPASLAGIPVIDGTNLSQNTIAAIENVAQTLKQIEEYQTQLEQYELQIQNSLMPKEMIWDAADSTISKLLSAIGTLDEFYGKFHDLEYYRKQPCFNGSTCTEADVAAIQDQNRMGTESQRKANEAFFKALEEQRTNLQSDATQLRRLQSTASGAEGHLQALHYANQIGSEQANQLLQIRALIIAKQKADVSRTRAENDRDARYDAGDEIMHRTKGAKRPNNPQVW